jgi:hypothetical protein
VKKLIGASVTSDLYLAGKTEDGQDYTAERYFVQVEFSNGERLRHTTFFNGCNPVQDDQEGYWHFGDVREEARAAADKLAERVNAGIQGGVALNMAYWDEARPVYGSPAYSEADQVQWEREQAELGN